MGSSLSGGFNATTEKQTIEFLDQDSIKDKFQDPLDLSGNRAAASTLRAARRSADTIGQMYDLSQQNILPFLQGANSLLPGLSYTASPEGALGYATAYAPMSADINRDAISENMRDLNSGLGASGMRRSGAGAEMAADVVSGADMSFLLSLQDFMNKRQQRIAGLGINSGTKLAALGQDTAERTGDILAGGILGGAQASAQGGQNIVNAVGTGLSFFNNQGEG
ncbi:hypothetical protein [uncultured Paraglaciecola sp.]|uniref:hypothetical protein n=1 Tax=uncultured Paraglaciecola sp. TaxID=1765024 RepID=UPI002611BB32|nr:hypothetical protein [uncultured Paraglaciecola sp.]